MTVELRKVGLVAIDGGCAICREEVALFRADAGPSRVLGKKTSTTFGLPSATFGEIRDRADLLLL